jgi:hypothetical protein
MFSPSAMRDFRRLWLSCLGLLIYLIYRWIEPLLWGHLSYKANFSLSQRWPLNTGLTVYGTCRKTDLWVEISFTYKKGVFIYCYRDKCWTKTNMKFTIAVLINSLGSTLYVMYINLNNLQQVRQMDLN